MINKKYDFILKIVEFGLNKTLILCLNVKKGHKNEIKNQAKSK